MSKFEGIKQENLKYATELEKALEVIMPIVIQAFINVYGEEHADYIRRTIESLNFCYFIPQSHLEVLQVYQAYLTIDDKELIRYYLAYINHLGYKYGKIRDNLEEKLKFIYRNFLAKSDLSLKELIDYKLVDALEDDTPIFTVRLNEINKEVVQIIFLPILTTVLEMVIHEINHALTTDAVGYIDDVVFEATLFCVNDMSSDTDHTAEEVVNDFIANLVLKEVYRLGGYVPPVLKKYDIGNDYVKENYIAEYLFERLGSLILNSLITKNSRGFINLVGKDNHQYLCELMSDLFNYGRAEEKVIELYNLIDEMAFKVSAKPEENVEAYIQELESLGYRVRLMH